MGGGERRLVDVSALLSGCLGLRSESLRYVKIPRISVIEDTSFCPMPHRGGPGVWPESVMIMVAVMLMIVVVMMVVFVIPLRTASVLLFTFCVSVAGREKKSRN